MSELTERINELQTLRAHLRYGEYNGDDIMRASFAIDELIECKAALSQQEAEPVDNSEETPIRHILNCASDDCVRCEQLLEFYQTCDDCEEVFRNEDGHKCKSSPPKPAPLPQPVASVPQVLRDMTENSVPLSAEFERAMMNNLPSLYECDDAPKPVPQGLEEFISKYKTHNAQAADKGVVSVEDLRTWIAASQQEGV